MNASKRWEVGDDGRAHWCRSGRRTACETSTTREALSTDPRCNRCENEAVIAHERSYWHTLATFGEEAAAYLDEHGTLPYVRVERYPWPMPRATATVFAHALVCLSLAAAIAGMLTAMTWGWTPWASAAAGAASAGGVWFGLPLLMRAFPPRDLQLREREAAHWHTWRSARLAQDAAARRNHRRGVPHDGGGS